MTLDEARREVESWFSVAPIGYWRTAPTGEPYVEICSGGEKDEGQCAPVLCASPDIAVALWLSAVREYTIRQRAGFAMPEPGTLYWRVPPEINGQYYIPVGDDGQSERLSLRRKMYCVYSRLLVSSRPTIWPPVIHPKTGSPAL